MPPKRKHKATKTSAAPASPSPRQAATRKNTLAESGSSRIHRRPSVSQGARTSRLQPSEPLHMTTRRASKAVSIHNSSAAQSLADADSRRNSLDSIANIDDHSDLEDERPAKRRRSSRTSAVSGSPDDSMGSFVSQIPVTEAQAARPAKATSRVPQTRKRRDSRDSSKTLSAAQNGVPARSESDDVPEKQHPRRKKRKTAASTATPPPEVADPPPGLTYDSTPAGSPDQPPDLDIGDDVQNVLPSAVDGAPAKAAKRLPGRRRQPHSDINVEIELRRQLHLKMGYRSTTKALKNLLDELSNRTVNSLENDPNYHKQFPAYQHVMNQLDDRRQERIDAVNADRRLHLEQLERIRIAQKHIEREQYINRFKDLQNDALLQCYYRMKQLQREMKRANGEATDDEENVVEPTHMEFPALNDDDRLGSKYASRSRAYVETERLLEEDEHRDRFGRVLNGFLAQDEDFSVPQVPNGFATYTGPDRAEAVAHHSLSSLLDACDAVEHDSARPTAPVVHQNEQADALFLLASLSADRPPATYQPKQSSYVTPYQEATTVHPTELQRRTSPFPPVSRSSDAAITDSSKDSAFRPAVGEPRREVNGVLYEHRHEPPKQVTPARTSHRISDILNNDQDAAPAPVEARSSANEWTPSMTTSRQQSTTQQLNPSRADPLRLQSIMHDQDQPSLQKRSGPEETASSALRSPIQSAPYWSDRRSTAGEADAQHKNPLVRIREMIEDGKQESELLAADLAPRRKEAFPTPVDTGMESSRRTPLLARPFSPYERSSSSSEQQRPRPDSYAQHSSYAPNRPYTPDAIRATSSTPVPQSPSYPLPGNSAPAHPYYRQQREYSAQPSAGYSAHPASEAVSEAPTRMQYDPVRRSSQSYSDSQSHARPLQSPNLPRIQPERPLGQPQIPRQDSQSSRRSSYGQSPSMSRSYLPGPSPRLSTNLALGPSPNVAPVQLSGQSPNIPYATSYAPSPKMPPAQSYAPSPSMTSAQSYTSSPGMPTAQYQGPATSSAPQEPPRRESLNPPRSQPGTASSTPAKPTNYRFAHYDPAPVNRPYPPPPPGWRPPNSSAPSTPTPAPPPQHYPNPYNGPPPPPGYPYPSYPPQPPAGYTVVAHQPGFVPPPGSFQAPPPPPPPLKMQQYGGTPILPASMAPGPPVPASTGPQSQTQPPPPPSQPQPQSQTPISSANPNSNFAQNYVGVPVNEHGQPLYDMPSPPRRNRPPTPQPRPRRQYRSYHAPGTQFRTYQGPDVKRKPNMNPNQGPSQGQGQSQGQGMGSGSDKGTPGA